MKITNKMIEAGLSNYSEGGCFGLDQHERREVVINIIQSALEVVSDNFVSDMTDENSDWNEKREQLENQFLLSGSALLLHTKAAKIQMEDYGVSVILEMSKPEVVN